MKLISSKDFGKTLTNVTNREYRSLRNKYDSFLEQPLTLGMFIPCDDDGNFLEEPKHEPFQDRQKFDDKCIEYQQVKERVLFEGFQNKKQPFFPFSFENRTIEDLIRYDLTLTKSAIKQLGL